MTHGGIRDTINPSKNLEVHTMRRGSFAAGFLTCLLLAGVTTTAYAAGIMAERSHHRIVVDGKELGESGINRLLADEFGVPVILASGDSEYGKQVEEELGCVFVETKKTLNNQCALCCSFNELKNRYTYGIQEALKVDEKPAGSSSHTMEITFHHSRNADFVSRMDNVEKMDDCTVRIEKETYKDLYALMRFVIKVCNAYA